MSLPAVDITLTEWQVATPQTDARLRDLCLMNDAARDTASRLEHKGALQVIERRDGLEICARSYVGKVRLGNLAITICPKIPSSALLRLIRYAYDLRNLHLFDDVDLDTQINGFQDLLWYQLAQEAEELTARGLQRTYLRREEYLANPRGAINLRELIQSGGINQAALPCVHYTRSEDYLPNQILLSGLQRGVRSAQSPRLQLRLRRLANMLREDVTPISLDKQAFVRLRAQSNRLIARYEPAITLIHLLLSSAGVSLDADSSVPALPGFLFDMNRFFQALLLRFLRENLAGYVVRDEARLSGAVLYNSDYNPLGRVSPSPRPDYLIMQNGKVEAVLDAKYRDLWERSLPREMLYQLAMYALVGGSERGAVILYPTMSLQASEQRLDICSPLTNARKSQVILRPVQLDTLEQMVFQQAGTQARRDKAVLAQQLVFGDVPHHV